MLTIEMFRTMCRYNSWMNDKLYTVCSAIPDADRKADKGAFFKSIHGTLNHLLLADRLWMARFTGGTFAAQSLGQELYSNFDELWQERKQTDAEIAAWIETLDAEKIAGQCSYTSMVNPEPRSFPLWFLMEHFFNHQTHHRGQITTLLEQSGYDSGVTDLLMLPTEIDD